MPRTPTFSSPPNFWETCLHSCCTFLTPYLLALSPSVPWKLFWQGPAVLGKVTGNFFRFYCIWTLPTEQFLSDVFFLWLLACPSLLVFGLIYWPSTFSHLLSISVLQVLFWAIFSPHPHILPWKTQWFLQLQPLLKNQWSWVVDFLNSTKLIHFTSIVKISLIIQLNGIWVLEFHGISPINIQIPLSA